MNIDEINIDEIKNSKGQFDCTIEDLKKIYILFNRPNSRVVKLYKYYYVSLEPAPAVQFKLTDVAHIESLGFIENKTAIDATREEKNIAEFLLYEFWQGENFFKRLLRFISTAIPLVLFNLILLKFATNNSLSNLLLGILTAISVFIAIFSLFTISHENIERKEISLFKTGKLGYLFSVDKNIAKLGISALVCALFAILMVDNSSDMFWNTTSLFQKILLTLLSNLSFLATFIVLRSIIEFYIHRPARFIFGDMKREYLESFDKQGKK